MPRLLSSRSMNQGKGRWFWLRVLGYSSQTAFFLHPGSPQERASMQKATSYLQPSGLVPRSGFGAMRTMSMGLDNVDGRAVVQEEVVPKSGVELAITNEKPLYPGEPIEVVVTVKSTAAGSWTVALTGSCQLQSYTGKVDASLGYINETVKLEGKSGRHGYCDMFYRLFNVTVWGFTRANA